MLPVIVAKIGGSLYDLPGFAKHVLSQLSLTLPPCRLLIFPGGGKLTDVLRDLDRQHHLGEETSHWLALRVLSVNAHMLGRLLSLPVITDPIDWKHDPSSSAAVLDPFPWAQADDANDGHCPHLWQVTSDSLALRLAQCLNADRLVLLKSSALPPELSWPQAADDGLVDTYFPSLMCQAPAITVTWLNART